MSFWKPAIRLCGGFACDAPFWGLWYIRLFAVYVGWVNILPHQLSKPCCCIFTAWNFRTCLNHQRKKSIGRSYKRSQSGLINRNEIELSSTHKKLCVPIINRIYRKMHSALLKKSGIPKIIFCPNQTNLVRKVWMFSINHVIVLKRNYRWRNSQN